MNSGYQGAYIHIFAQDPTREGRWALDERFWICVSGCDDYYEERAFLYGAYLYPPWPATPQTATPVAGTVSLQPITPDECDIEALSDEQVSAIAQGSENDTEQSYVPIGPAHDALAQEVAEADRAWQSCYVYGTAAERAALQSPRLTRDGPGQALGSETSREAMVANLDQFDASRELGEVMLTGDWQDYYIESDLMSEFVTDPVTGIVQALPDFIPMAPLPDQAVRLADGRVALPHAQLIPPHAYSDALETEEDLLVWWIPVHILVQEPDLDGRWVVDETLTICMGDCDLARAGAVDYIAELDSLVASPEATPVATPQAWRERPLG